MRTNDARRTRTRHHAPRWRLRITHSTGTQFDGELAYPVSLGATPRVLLLINEAQFDLDGLTAQHDTLSQDEMLTVVNSTDDTLKIRSARGTFPCPDTSAVALTTAPYRIVRHALDETAVLITPRLQWLGAGQSEGGGT